MHAVYWNVAFMCTKKDVLSAVMRELRKYRKLWIQHYFNFQRTFVHDCRSWVIILYRTVSFKISSYSRPYVRIMHESTKAQISLRPSLGKETFNLKNRSICDDIQTCKVSTSRFLPPSLFIILFFPWFYYYYHCYYFFIIIFFWPNC